MPEDSARSLQRDSGVLVEGRDDEQDGVRAVGARLPHLVAGDHEVLAQHRDVDRGAHGVEVVEAAAEAALLGEHADHAGAAGRVVRRRARPGRRSSASAPLLGLERLTSAITLTPPPRAARRRASRAGSRRSTRAAQLLQRGA